VYRESRLTGSDILAMDAPRVVLATGATWRRDGFGRHNHRAIPIAADARVLTPDDIMSGADVTGPVVVFDDDDYYMGGVLAETLRRRGLDVTLVTPAALASAWTVFTLEQEKIQKRLLEIGVTIVANQNLASIGGGEAELYCVFTQRRSAIAAATVVLVTARVPNAALHDELAAALGAAPGHPVKSVTRIGDCIVPGTIAYAVFEGRRFAEQLDDPAHAAAGDVAQAEAVIRLRTEPVVLQPKPHPIRIAARR
jgi:dimethylamine/trimethylamine dehydrogenase